MFTKSTQKRYWLFNSNQDLDEMRRRSNESFVRNYYEKSEEQSDIFLSPNEERQLCQLVEETAQKFCQSFEPNFLPTVVYTGFVYFKRFYLHNSVMEHLAKNIMMSCLYLACKVDEFNVSIDEFVRNLKSGTPQSNASIILNLEAPVLRQLQYHLIVHAPYRPMEGHFIQMKTSFPDNIGKLVESMRPICEEFLWKCLLTDACFLYTPSQIALAAIAHTGEKLNLDIYENYIVNILCDHQDRTISDGLVSKVKNCVELVTSVQGTTQQTASLLQTRVQQCMQLLEKINAQRSKRKLEYAAADDNNDDHPAATDSNSKRKRSASTEEDDVGARDGSDSDDDDDD